MRIFIGCGPRFEQPTEALIASIYENCSQPDRLDIRLMEAWADPLWSDWYGQPTEENFGRVKGNWVTPFSLFRYAIPEICHYDGFAIYLDADMIVMGDICELWSYQQPGKWVTARGPSGDCVTVMDCSAFRPEIATLRKNGNKWALRNAVSEYVVRQIPDTWNHCDRYEPGVSNLIHFTSMVTQPFRPYPEVLDYQSHPDRMAYDLYSHWVARANEWQFECPTNS